MCAVCSSLIILTHPRPLSPFFSHISAAQEELERAKADHALSLDNARFAARVAEQHSTETAGRCARVLQDQARYLEALVSSDFHCVSASVTLQELCMFREGEVVLMSNSLFLH